MSHIANLLAANPSGNNVQSNCVSRDISPHVIHEIMTESSPADEKDKGREKFIWRMHQPMESTRKYQLFPSKEKQLIQPGRRSPEMGKNPIVGQSSSTIDRPLLGAAMRLKAKEQTLVRRRKASVPELGPMTTVQEIAMDSPTIPGRPPLHERSISVPGYNSKSWKHNVFGDNLVSRLAPPALDEKPELSSFLGRISPTIRSQSPALQTLRKRRSGSPSQTQPMSPKDLAPLVIPVSNAPQPHVIVKQSSLHQLNDDTPPTVPPKSARMLPEEKPSPQSRTPYTPYTPYTPLTASTTSAISTAPSSSISATPPVSATTDGRNSPLSAAISVSTVSARGPSPMGLNHARGFSESSVGIGSTHGHRRERSDASIIDRGRPKKRTDGSPFSLRRTPSKQLRDQKAFEMLPVGTKAIHAGDKFTEVEIDSLKKQAVGQAAQFEVLSFKDVEDLSRELRALDERCDYLRKTHHSLRSGRRNLHERICTYLRSPRIAQFSHTSLLKQEEALIELDLSIDDWVSKLEQADNRRTRVRQKLLEHVAAALTLSSPTFPSPLQATTTSTESSPKQVTAPQMMTMAMHRSMGENTPPRSPTKASHSTVQYASSPSRSPVRPASPPSPVRLAAPIEVQEPVHESKIENYESRMSKESIRIYADSDVYALLADVEEEFSRMGDKQVAPSILPLPTLGQGVFEPPSRSGTPRAVTPSRSVTPKAMNVTPSGVI